MASSFQVLIDVLTDIYQLQLEMIELAKHKKQVLISGEIDELAKLIQRESIWVKKIGKLEEERQAIAKQLVESYGISHSDNLTISDLIEMSPSPQEKAGLQRIYSGLKDSFEQVRQLNELNTDLIKQSIDYISTSFELITGSNKGGITYSKPTAKVNNQLQQRGIFDRKA